MKDGRASLTALGVALLRAGSAGLRAPYVGVRDDVGLALLPAPYRAMALALRRGGTRGFVALDRAVLGLASHVVLRTLQIDRLVGDAVLGGARQMVLLGAGYDTRAHRLELPGVRAFEIDFPATQEVKRRRVPHETAPTYVSVDFERDDLAAAVLGAGFDPAASSVWLWEGVTVYLTRAARRATLAAVARVSAPGSTLIVTYSRGEDLDWAGGLAGRLGGRLVGERVLGLTSTGEFHDDLRAAGFDVVGDTDASAWRARSWPDAAVWRRPVWEHIAVATRR